jgi:glycosyltransferase involved in cell wall biosynthesis/predicted O-methyltransferase YrrM
MSAAHFPLVSCIMPTYNRRAFVPQAIFYFLRQDYPSKELIIIDDGSESVEDLIPPAENIRYYRLPSKLSLGAKLNLACEYAQGAIIANWDDDDWYAPWRLSYQMKTMQESNIELCGINKLLYYDLQNKTGYQYIYPSDQRIWLLGSSQCYRKSWWGGIRFADTNVGMDGLFSWATPPEKVKALDDHRFAVHLIHPQNVSPKQTNGVWWHPHPVEDLTRTVGPDWDFYAHDCDPNYRADFTKYTPFLKKSTSFHPEQQKTGHRAVFACLVHEKADCVVDMVKNLRFFNPDVTILLYNGGNDADLLANHTQLHENDAIIVPNAQPQPYGYLHGFAVDCMDFALKCGDFDSMTIVDSDQLCLRSGYVPMLADFFKKHPNAGLLSSMPARVLPHQIQHSTAVQAYREQALWKPLLDAFPNSHDAFVHWTFWPSTVFSYAAVRDLVALFKENALLQNIIQHSKIWASEEVFFPTLVRLLGYDIVQNPCSHELIHFRKQYQPAQIERAFETENAFWVHPVKRELNDPVRQTINAHIAANTLKLNVKHNGFDKRELPELLQAIQPIEGWLSTAEATLLAESLFHTLQTIPAPHNIVEIGSYHGKATVLMGKLLKKYHPKARLHAIDPHDGLLGAADQGLTQFPPSYENFTKNIADAGLKTTVKPVKSVSTAVKWNKPIAFLLIDGLHDYAHVAQDFKHFAPYLVPGAYVAFHDYAAYFPGVKAFVDELLLKGGFLKMKLVESLIVLQKL